MLFTDRIERTILRRQLALDGGERGIIRDIRHSPFGPPPLCGDVRLRHAHACLRRRTSNIYTRVQIRLYLSHLTLTTLLRGQLALDGGERGIRTLDTLPYTHFPGVLLRPLGHLSKFR